MWTYVQRTGSLSQNGEFVASGYSGAGIYKNDPNAQARHNERPIPEGLYTIGEPHDTTTHGPFVLPLTPDAENRMFGRSGFLIHGDSIMKAGTASQGCIVLPRKVREQIWQSGDTDLEVV